MCWTLRSRMMCLFYGSSEQLFPINLIGRTSIKWWNLWLKWVQRCRIIFNQPVPTIVPLKRAKSCHFSVYSDKSGEQLTVWGFPFPQTSVRRPPQTVTKIGFRKKLGIRKESKRFSRCSTLKVRRKILYFGLTNLCWLTFNNWKAFPACRTFFAYFYPNLNLFWIFQNQKLTIN